MYFTFVLLYFSFIVLFSDEKYQKSFKRIFHPLKNLLPRARVSRASRAWQVRAAKDIVKVGGFAALHSFIYTTRANIAHEKAEQIRARIVCTPAESARRACGSACADGMESTFFILAILGFYLVGVVGELNNMKRCSRYHVSATPTFPLHKITRK